MRKSQSIYIDKDVFEAFNKYALLHFPKKIYEVWEEMMVERMQSRPVNGLKVSVQQRIAETLPSKQEKINMSVISRRIEAFMKLIDELNEGEDASKLKEKISKWMNKGLNVRNPTDEFLSLLEEALKYI